MLEDQNGTTALTGSLTMDDAVWILAERPPREHVAQLYPSDNVLIESLRMFTTHGLSRGEAVVLVLTPAHQDALLYDLKTAGVDIGHALSSGQLLVQDAAILLTRFMVNAMPDPVLFRFSVGELLARVRGTNHPRMRVFGEMVDLLWKSNLPAAIRLEHLWNEVLEESNLSLFCAYAANHVHDHFPTALRTPHSHIISSAMIESSNDAIVGHTLDRRIVSWNRGAQRLYGYTPAEVIGQSSAILMPPGENELFGVIDRIRAGERVDHYEARRRRKDGRVIDVSIAVTPVTTGNGELIGVSVVGRDITERKQRDEAVQRLAAIVESSDDAIISKTLDATIVSWNAGAERLYGYTAGEVVGKSIAILIPDGMEDELPAIMARLRRGERVAPFETKRRRKNGTTVAVSLVVSPIKSLDGDIIGASAVARDITERKEAEAARAEVARLEHAHTADRLLLRRVFEGQEQERQRIARELHDEAGQLMASLLVGLRALEDNTRIEESKHRARHLREIAVAALDQVARLARGLHTSVVEELGLVVALKRYISEYAQLHNIAIDIEPEDLGLVDVPKVVELGLFRIVQEALTNVARHSGATSVSIRIARSPTGLETTITDNGSGFSVDAQRASPETHLGLQGMKERAIALGGTLNVTSGVTGTAIRVEFPFSATDPQRKAEEF
jgi:PAS domain S-box-containing protein